MSDCRADIELVEETERRRKTEGEGREELAVKFKTLMSCTIENADVSMSC